MAQGSHDVAHDGTKVGPQPTNDPDAGRRCDGAEGAPYSVNSRIDSPQVARGKIQDSCSRHRSERRLTRGTSRAIFTRC